MTLVQLSYLTIFCGAAITLGAIAAALLIIRQAKQNAMLFNRFSQAMALCSISLVLGWIAFILGLVMNHG